MSSGLERGSVIQLPVPFAWNLWRSSLPNAICRTVSEAGFAGAALALAPDTASAPVVPAAPAVTTAAASHLPACLLKSVMGERVRPARDAGHSPSRHPDERPASAACPESMRLVKS